MINASAHASVYTDFQGLAKLKAEAGRQSPESMRETARQFEALFVQTMLKAMRDASPGGGLFDSDQTEFYRDMYDRQLALEMVKGEGLGIAGMLVRDMHGASAHAAVPLDNTIKRQQTPLIPMQVQARPVIPENRQPDALVDLQAVGAAPAMVATPVMQDWHPEGPEDFIHKLMPLAQRGAAELGVDPKVLVAQAALETGWGRKMIRHADGRNSFNLFGIKADGRWDGDRAVVSTLEYRGDVPRREQAAFRSYDSLAASIDGYVDFIQTNPRYAAAIEKSNDSVAYLQELKNAGYATDPLYVKKIRSIMDTHSFDPVSDQLALDGHVPAAARAGL